MTAAPAEMLATVDAEKRFGDSSSRPNSDVEVGRVGVVENTPGDGDEALRFLKNQHDVGELTAEEEKKLLRKIDWMIMPLMWSCYCLQYLDKTLGMKDIDTSTMSWFGTILICRSKLRSRHGPL